MIFIRLQGISFICTEEFSLLPCRFFNTILKCRSYFYLTCSALDGPFQSGAFHVLFFSLIIFTPTSYLIISFPLLLLFPLSRTIRWILSLFDSFSTSLYFSCLPSMLLSVLCSERSLWFKNPSLIIYLLVLSILIFSPYVKFFISILKFIIFKASSWLFCMYAISPYMRIPIRLSPNLFLFCSIDPFQGFLVLQFVKFSSSSC